jgi:predicted RNase H-like nuclease
MTWVVGADGFKRAWRVVLCELDTDQWLTRDVAAFVELLELEESPAIICVDMPIGLNEHTPKGGRDCDKLAREALGARSSSVFSAVGRQALLCRTRAEADAVSRAGRGIGIGAQAWGLALKLREVDTAMSADRQAVVFEAHPELCFWAMNDRAPMDHSKKSARGEDERRKALIRGGAPEAFLKAELGRLKTGRDDFLDACAAAWTARRVALRQAERRPAQPVRDARGLDMAIWC